MEHKGECQLRIDCVPGKSAVAASGALHDLMLLYQSDAGNWGLEAVAVFASEVPAAVVREMTLDDAPTVSAMEQRLFPLDGWPPYMFIDELSQTDTRRYLVAVAASRIVGYAGLMCIEPVADVQTITVDPDFEGRGIGSVLLTELTREAARRRAKEVLLEVRADNPRAQQLYLRFGFEQIHIRRRYYRDGVDALVMRLKLIADETTTAADQQ